MAPRGGKWIVQSAIDYARICNAVVEGIRTSMLRGEKVACGATAARGNNNPKGLKPSVSPLAFLRAMKKAGATGFDAYAHHPYYGGPGETPATPSPGRGGVTLGNIDALVSELTRLYGKKRIWITEYGYQTNPPDGVFGVSWATQAAYVRQSFAIARAHPRIDMLLWFLLQDEADPDAVAVRADLGGGRAEAVVQGVPRVAGAPLSSASSPGRWRRQSCGRPACSTS